MHPHVKVALCSTNLPSTLKGKDSDPHFPVRKTEAEKYPEVHSHTQLGGPVASVTLTLMAVRYIIMFLGDDPHSEICIGKTEMFQNQN